jgi:hypothetical protein
VLAVLAVVAALGVMFTLLRRLALVHVRPLVLRHRLYTRFDRRDRSRWFAQPPPRGERIAEKRTRG